MKRHHMTGHTDTPGKNILGGKPFTLFLVFVVALAVRLVHLNSYTSFPAFDVPLGGSAAYVKTAFQILDGNLLGGDEIFYDNSPIYSYILAGLFQIFGIDFYAVRFVQVLLGSINCGIIAWISCHLFGRKAALVSGGIAALYGPLIFYDAEIIVLPWVLFFSLTAIVLLMNHGLDSLKKLCLTGCFMGAAVMGRPNLILFPALLLPLFLLFNRKTNMARRVLSYACLWLGFFMIPGLFMARNFAVSGEIVFLNPTGGHNFYFGHHEGASPFFNETLKFKGSIFLKYKEMAEAESGRPLSPKEVSSHWYKKGIRFIVENPVEELTLSLKKILFFFNDMEMPTYFNYYFNRDYSVVLKHGGISFGLIFPLAVLGFLMTLKRDRNILILHMFLLTSLLSALIIFVISRLRIPAIPVFIVFAGAGVMAITEWCRARAWKPLVLGGILLVPLYWMTFTPFVQLSYAEPYNHLGAVLWSKGQIDEAEDSFLKALALRPDFEYPLLNLIKMFGQQGDREKENEYRRRHATWKERFAPRKSSAREESS